MAGLSNLHPNTLLRAAQEARPASSFFGSILSLPINLGGSIAHKLGLRSANTPLGTDLLQKHFLSPLSKTTDFVDELGGKALGELPGVEMLFRRHLKPDDIAAAARKMKIGESDLASLVGKASEGKAGFSHRLSAPVESDFFRNIALPMGAGAFVLDKLKATPESRAREAIQMKHNRDVQHAGSERKRLAKQYLGLGDTESIPKLGHAAHAWKETGESNMAQSHHEEMQKKAAIMLDRMTKTIRNMDTENKALRTELGLYKEAASMVEEGILPQDRIHDFVAGRLPHDASIKIGQRLSPQGPPEPTPPTPSTPTTQGQSKQASLLGLLEDDTRPGQSKMGSVGSVFYPSDSADERNESYQPSAQSVMDAFVLGGGSDGFSM